LVHAAKGGYVDRIMMARPLPGTDYLTPGANTRLRRLTIARSEAVGCALLVWLAAAVSAGAATLFWDADANPANGAGGGSGTWDTASLTWFDGTTNVAWNNAANHDAVFGGAGGVVTTAGDLTANTLTFATGPYVLFNSGNAQKLALTSGLISVAAGREANIYVNLTNAVGVTNVGISKIGPGKLFLSRNNSFYGGLRVLEGTLSLSNKFQIGASGGSLIVNGGTLELTPAQAAQNQNVTGRTLFLGDNGATISVLPSPFGAWLFSDVQGGSGVLNKTGDGVLTFSGPGARSGPTVVDAGTMRVNNTGSSALGSGPVTVHPGGTLDGNGLVAGPVSVAGAIAPGADGAGLLTLQSGLDLSGGGTYRWELAALKDDATGAPGTDFDHIALTGGALTLGAAAKLEIQFTGSATPPDAAQPFWQTNRTWRIIALSGSATHPGASNFGALSNAVFVAGTFSTIPTSNGVLLRFTPPGGGPAPALVVSPTNLVVPEGGSNAFTVQLSAAPTNPVTVSVTFDSGDGDLFVAAGAALLFNATNWNVPQTVTLAAAEDADALNGQATFAVAAPGMATRWVIATEADNDWVAPTNRPNFVILCTDDMRWDSLGVVQRERGSEARFPWFETPNLDRLAAGGVRFRNAFVVHSLCSPSRASMLTGRYGHLNGIIDNQTPFPTNAVTWATLLASAGYINGYVGKWHMGQQVERPGFHYAASFLGQGDYETNNFIVNGVTNTIVGWVDDVSTDFATNFIFLNRTNSFALFVGFKTPHNPVTPPARLLDLYSTNVAGPILNSNAVPPWDSNPSYPSTARIRDYHRCVYGVDENVGRLLDLLDRLDLASNTVVIFLSDNGRYLGEHGQGDKRSAYEESLRIPFLLRYPKLVGPSNLNDHIVLNLDLAPTILDLAGLPVPANMQGRSLKPLLLGQTNDWRDTFFYEYFVEGGSMVPNLYALRTTTNKLVFYPEHPEWAELYALLTDPYETNNLIAQPGWTAIRAALETELVRQMRHWGLLAELRAPQRSGGVFQFTLAGGFGPRWQLQRSDDGTNWTTFATVAMTNLLGDTAEALATDSAATGPRRFYRARLLANQ
jgi:autotransporter-associated beta strand protein